MEETRNWVHEAIEKRIQGEKEEYVIIDNGEFIGMISPSYPSPTESEIGMWITPNKQGEGYGKRALEALFEILKSKGVSKVVYTTDKLNQASINLALSLGFEKISEGDEIVFAKKL